LDEHRRIVDAIAAHDPVTAAEAIRAHLSSVAARMRARLGKET
jgi:DNA-binding FadR family transcriptional regulator